MLFFRLVFGLLLISGLLCFAAYAFTGQPAWRQRGLKIIKWTLVAALVLGAGILLERVLPRA
jgi:hypothetical protein